MCFSNMCVENEYIGYGYIADMCVPILRYLHFH